MLIGKKSPKLYYPQRHGGEREREGVGEREYRGEGV
jgi:hypothetical protein